MSGDEQVVKDFFHYVNMTAEELEEWLDNPNSMHTGQAAEDGEPKGRKSGRKILDILKKKDKNYTEEEITHMRHCNAYNKRHLAQGPGKEVEESKWRYSHLNWGCDPLKKPLGDRDYAKVSDDSQAKADDKKGQPKSEEETAKGEPSSPKKGSTKKEDPRQEESKKKEDQPASPQKRKSEKQDNSPEKKPKKA